MVPMALTGRSFGFMLTSGVPFVSDFYFDPNNRCRFPLVEALSDPALNQELEKVKREGGEEALKALIRERFPERMPLLYPEDAPITATTNK